MQYFHRLFSLLDTFAELPKATTGIVTNVYLLVRMEEFGPHRTECDEYYRQSMGEIQFSLKSDKNKGYFTCRPSRICDISPNTS